METWKQHPTMHDVWVSDKGNVKRRINKCHPERKKDWHYFGKDNNTDRSGYTTVRVVIRRKNYVVARLVAETFLGLEPHQVVRHRDNNSLNNDLANILVGSQRDNIRDKAAHGTWQGGDRHPKTKYTDGLVRKIQMDLECGNGQRGLVPSLAGKYCVPIHFVYDVARGRRKTLEQRVEDVACSYSDVT